MPAVSPLKRPVKVSQLMRRRLRELKRTPRELAEAVQVPETYIADLLAGRRRPPAPGRTDVYERMTKFLRLHRNDLSTCAGAERAGTSLRGRRAGRRLDTRVLDALLELCAPAKARPLARRLGSKHGPELEQLIVQRILEVTQGFVRRQLDDEVGIRVAANREGCSYLEMRMRLLEFLDTTPQSVTPADLDEFVRPQVGTWDLDLETQAMRIVLRTQDPAPRQKRALRL